MPFPPVPPISHRRCGVALIIVLAFVVLLTGLIVAFFSRVLSDRQISGSSANGTRVDIFAAGAVNTVLGDFRQEIAAGSTQLTLTPAVPGVTIYSPVGAAAAPCLVGTVPADGLANLIKRSAYQQAFYAGSAYDTGNFPPSSRAAQSSSIANSLNGRAISPARWNKALLLPKKDLTPTNDTDFTPVGATAATGTAAALWPKAPDWVVVARDGTNPVAWNTALAINGANPAVGRFAYNVYDEGGVLDANAAGFPAPVASGAPTSNYAAYLPGYKGSLAFADLKQLPGIGSLASTRQEQIVRTLVGWRNYASTGIDPTQAPPAVGSSVTGSVNILPGYQWTGSNVGTNVANFLNFAQINGTGFLRTANPLLVNGQSDRLFGSRQQLLDLLLQSVADQSAAGATERASLQNDMQYLGTFSRSLSQPSYVPPAGRPKVLPLASGGNYEAPNNDDQINPAFLSVRVTSSQSGGRNNGTDLIAGEPLVKKRFPLSRLAWLTYKGPSKGRTGDDINDLKTNFGYTQTFLDQGDGPTVQKYFGLSWNAGGYWSYDVGVATNSSTGGIMTLKQVRDGGTREPNFVELLKAAITAGALGKSGAQGSGPNDNSPLAIQFDRDSSIDFQIIQLTANIIDQFDVDGFPTRIQFSGQEFRGVENLPYLYRVRNGLYRIINPVPMPTNSNTDTDPSTVLNNPGAFIMVEQPEIWNPHSYDPTNSATLNRSLGNPRPTNLQMVVYGGAPALPPAVPSVFGNSSVFPRFEGSDGPAPNTLSPAITDATTKMTFSNGEALYREPTLLIKPNVPSGSNLQAPGFAAAATSDGLGGYVAGGGIKVLDSAAIAYGMPEPNPGLYCGIYLGKNVVAYLYPNSQLPTQTRYAGQAHFSAPQALTYQIQCQSPFGTGMAVYDEKYFTEEPYTDFLPYNRSMLSISATDVNTYSGRLILGVNRMMTCFDPRTSRFGMLNSPTGDNVNFQDQEFAVPGIQSPGAPRWIDKANFPNVVASNRQDLTAGFGMGNGQSYGGTPNNAPAPGAYGWNWNVLLRFGLFSQNNPLIPNDDLRFTGDTNVHNMGNGPQYYTDADGVPRRAMGAYVSAGTGTPRLSGSTTTGLPMATAYYAPFNGDARQKESRPIILNRPFRSVAELGCVFSDTPWKNIDLSTVESGYSPLLDVFCVNDTDDPAGLVAGKVDLNTRQTPVFQAVMSGAYKDEYNGAASPMAVGDAQTLANKLIARTTGVSPGTTPLASLADLVGGWKSGSGTSANYDGFAADVDSINPPTGNFSTNNISRYRESATRALAAVGNARVWNLMIDLVAQTGRYPQSANNATNPLAAFVVEGEQRYWVHVAIDRYTGQVIDKQVEIVKE